jgi:hypothetical protein
MLAGLFGGSLQSAILGGGIASVGYGADLLSGMNKIRTQSDLLVDTAYVKSVMDLIEKREYNIARMIKANHDNTNSPWLLKHSKMLNDILPTEQVNYNKESVFKDILIYNENVYNSVLDEYIQEGSLFKKKLKYIRKFIFFGTLLGRHIPKIAEKLDDYGKVINTIKIN